MADLGVWQEDAVCLYGPVHGAEEHSHQERDEGNGLTSIDSQRENKRPESPEKGLNRI